jgi:hypothetical protein
MTVVERGQAWAEGPPPLDDDRDWEAEAREMASRGDHYPDQEEVDS